MSIVPGSRLEVGTDPKWAVYEIGRSKIVKLSPVLPHYEKLTQVLALNPKLELSVANDFSDSLARRKFGLLLVLESSN